MRQRPWPHVAEAMHPMHSGRAPLYVQARKQQANFQLIVITHDEEFVQMIGRTDNCSHYFRVDKRLSDNSNHNAAPHSVIDRFEIGRFG